MLSMFVSVHPEMDLFLLLLLLLFFFWGGGGVVKIL